MCLVRTLDTPDPVEYYVAACMVNFFLEKIRQVVASEPSNDFIKMKVFVTETKWNLCDTIAIVVFLVAFALRLIDAQLIKYAHVTYGTIITYW